MTSSLLFVLSDYMTYVRETSRELFLDNIKSPLLLCMDATLMHPGLAGYRGTDDTASRVKFKTRILRRLSNFAPKADSQRLEPAGQAVVAVARGASVYSGRVSVGRARRSGVMIFHSAISKFHAYFAWNPDRQSYVISDAESTNGTYLRSKRLEPHHAKPILSGDDLQFGPFRFVFFTPGEFFDYVSGLLQEDAMVRTGDVTALTQHRRIYTEESGDFGIR